MNQRTKHISTLRLGSALVFATAVALSACSDDDKPDAGGLDAAASDAAADAGTRMDARVEDDAATTDADTTDSGFGDAEPVDVGTGNQRFLVQLDPRQGEILEGIAVGGDDVYAGLFALGRVLKVDPNGQTETFGTINGAAGGATLGLDVADDGSIFVLFARSSTTATATTGVYRIPAAGGVAVLFATDPNLVFPNDLDVDDQGDIFLTDSLAGAIYKVRSNGSIDLWLMHETLGSSVNPNDLPCGSLGAGFPIGANGIVVTADSVVVANTERATLVRIPIENNGMPGTPEVIAGPDCANLLGVDGIAADGPSSWLAVVQAGAKLVRVRADGSVTVLETGGLLDGPASVETATIATGYAAFVANSTFVPPPTNPRGGPGVVVVDLE